MRKFIWLALAIGAAELLKRYANKRGLTVAALSTIAASTAARITSAEPERSPKT